MKRWSAVLVILLLASTMQGVFAVQDSGKPSDMVRISKAPLNPEFIEYHYTSQVIERVKSINSERPLGLVPEPVDTTYLKGKKVSKKALLAEMQGIADVSAYDMEDTAPATYNLRTLGRVSPVKDQGECGSCWAFATYGSMESELLPDQLYDFSENNLKNTHGFDYGACSGGNSQMATAYLARWSGAVAEADDPYVDSSTTSPTGLPVQAHAQEILIIPGRSGSLDNDNIKASLQTTGALYTNMYWDNSFYNYTSKAYYYDGPPYHNHAVTIVGWNDTYSRTNFNQIAPGDGAFIIKNSWGTSFGDNGYFYISYYDSRIGQSLSAFTGESAANYNHIYQYDPLGWTSTLGYDGSDTAWEANVFTATSTESLEAVGFYTTQVDTAYQIFIYTNPDQGPISSAGPVSTVQGTIGIPGYHTVTLPTPVSVNAGQKFSVVVRFQTPNWDGPIAIEDPQDNYSSQATASAGQSYVSSTGSTWTDLTSFYSNANSCLKAYTVNTGTTSPVANFSASPTSGTYPLTVTFTDTSTNSPTSWEWTFGDEGTSTLKSPSHQYTTAGTYTVTLKATNTAGNNTLTRTDYITVNAPARVTAPVASFTASSTSGATPFTVTFTDTSINSPTSWEWTFGDEGTSTLKSPSHQYTTAGTYTVTLKATNTAGNNTLTRTNYITAITPAPVASFTASPTSGISPFTVTFTDTTINSPTSWEWTFGDTGTSTLQNPSHQYTTAGNYTVTLKASSTAGNNTRTRTNYITVNPGAPVASFTASPTSGVKPLTVTFTDTSINSPTSWAWTFDDGGTSKLQNPAHQYTAAGTHTVTLTVMNAKGSNKITKTKYITVYAVAPVSAPVANFTASPTSGVKPLTVTFTDTSSNLPTSWAWTFGDSGTSTLQNPSHQYTTVGTFTVTLKASSTAGNNTLTKTNYITVNPVAPVASFTASPTSGTNPLTVTFTDTSINSPTSWAWSFGDGGTSTLKSPSHQYTTDGTYTVTLKSSNTAGNNTLTRTNYITVIAPAPVTAPVASFTGSPTSGVSPLTVTFSDQSTGSPTDWAWYFGDTGTSTLQNPSHQYTTIGTYTVTLKASNTAGNNSLTRTDYITVNVPAPVANFTASPTSGVSPLNVTFTDTSTNSPTSWAWTFGDTGTSTLQNPSHQYTTAGTYTVTLKASNTAGNNSLTKTNYITVTVAPVANFTTSPTSGVSPLTVTFTDTSTNSPTSWNWTFGDGGTSPLKSPSHQYTTAGNYTVTLKASNAAGNNSLTRTNYITVNAPAPVTTPVASFTASPISGTNPLTVTFTDTSINSPTSWAWTFGDGGTSPLKSPSHQYTTAGTYAVTLKVTNTAGSNTLTRTNYITVNAVAPVANFTASTTSGIKPLTVTFTDTSTNSPTSWAWTFDDGGTSKLKNPAHQYTAAGTFTVTLTATNEKGSSKITKTNYIRVTNS